jgi:hypothetical protein
MQKWLCSSVIISFITLSAYAECTAKTSYEIADKITHGRTWLYHGNDFLDKKIIANLPMPETPRIDSIEGVQEHILTIITTIKGKSLPNGRQVYWDESTGTMIFYDPLSNDCGVAYRPRNGKNAYTQIESAKMPKQIYIKILSQNNDQFSSAYVARFKEQSKNVSGYQCDGREYCSQMHSCEEAKFFLNNCPNPKMDGNGDGIPCEMQWCH